MSEETITAGTEAAPQEGQVTIEPAQPATPERDPNRVYTQAEMDAIAAKIKKNERYRTRKEVEAFYQGRESVAKPVEAAPPPKVDEPPTRDQFDSYEAFIEAKAVFAGKTAAREERTRVEQEQKAQAEEKTRHERLTNFQKTTAEKFPDLNERAAAVEHISMPDGMGDAIAESEFGPEVLNHLVSNPKDFERIASLSPSSALREIGRLEARFEAAKENATKADEPKTDPVKKVSSVPAPINPVAGKTVVGDGEPSHDKPDEWMAWRNRQVAKRKATG